MSDGDEGTMRVGEIMRHRVGGWLPTDQGALEAWLAGLRSKVEAREEPAELHPIIVEFQELIATDPVVRMCLDQMIAEVPKTKKYRKRHLKSVDQMLTLINEVLTQAPDYNTTSLVGAPLNAIIDWAMGSPRRVSKRRDQRDVQEDPRRLVRIPERAGFALRAERRPDRMEEPGRSQGDGDRSIPI